MNYKDMIYWLESAKEFSKKGNLLGFRNIEAIEKALNLLTPLAPEKEPKPVQSSSLLLDLECEFAVGFYAYEGEFDEQGLEDYPIDFFEYQDENGFLLSGFYARHSGESHFERVEPKHWIPLPDLRGG